MITLDEVLALTEATHRRALRWTINGRSLIAENPGDFTEFDYVQLRLHHGPTVTMEARTDPAGRLFTARKIIGIGPRAAALHHLATTIERQAGR